MPATALTVADITRAGTAPALTAANADGHLLPNTGLELLMVTNGSGAPINVSLALAKTVDGQTAGPRVVAVPASATRLIGPFPVSEYNNASSQVSITFSAVTDLTVQALRLPRAG